MEGGGYWWVLIDVIAVVVLGAAIFYGFTRWRARRRSLSTDRATEQAVKREYTRERE